MTYSLIVLKLKLTFSENYAMLVNVLFRHECKCMSGSTKSYVDSLTLYTKSYVDSLTVYTKYYVDSLPVYTKSYVDSLTLYTKSYEESLA